jgi:signal transduction histidine kinase
MSLRRRLLLSLLLTAVPLVGAAVWLRIEVDRWAGEQAFRDLAAARVEAWGREACEADPTDPPGPGRGPRPRRPSVSGQEEEGPPPASSGREVRRRRFPLRLFAYDRTYRPADAGAPPFPASLRADLDKGETVVAAEETEDRGHRHLMVAVRTGWDDGPCAVVLARGLQPLVGPPIGGLLVGAAALAGAFLVAVWVAAGPVVRRLRGLTAAVGQSSATHYAKPVDVAGRDEIAELARAFNDAASQVRAHVARVEAREQTLRTFVANTTHDVMLPLTVLQGYLAALRQSAHEGHCDPDVVQSASEEAHYLASLVHNLGAAAKLEAGEPHVERHPVNLNELVERAAGRHRPIADPRGIEVNTAVPERTLLTSGDVTLIEQAVSNVIHNAVRYNQPGGHVAVVLEPHDGRFRLRVFDDGPGVPEELFGRLAEPRYRADDARTRSPAGQGLGLSIARQVADRHGFGMEIRRSEAGGLEVEFEGSLMPA